MRRHISVLAVALFVSPFFATGVQSRTAWYVDDDNRCAIAIERVVY